MFSNIEIEEDRYNYHKSPIFSENVDVKKVLVSHKTSSFERNYKFLLVTCMMIIKLIHYI